MGMAASQSRLLSLTSRLSDLELRAQQISNSKVRLATDTTEIAKAYSDELCKEKLQFVNVIGYGDNTYKDLTANMIIDYDPESFDVQRLLKDSSGKLLVSESTKNAYEASGGDFEKFLIAKGYYSTATPPLSLQDIANQKLADAKTAQTNATTLRQNATTLRQNATNLRQNATTARSEATRLRSISDNFGTDGPIGFLKSAKASLESMTTKLNSQTLIDNTAAYLTAGTTLKDQSFMVGDMNYASDYNNAAMFSWSDPNGLDLSRKNLLTRDIPYLTNLLDAAIADPSAVNLAAVKTATSPHFSMTDGPSTPNFWLSAACLDQSTYENTLSPYVSKYSGYADAIAKNKAVLPESQPLFQLGKDITSACASADPNSPESIAARAKADKDATDAETAASTAEGLATTAEGLATTAETDATSAEGLVGLANQAAIDAQTAANNNTAPPPVSDPIATKYYRTIFDIMKSDGYVTASDDCLSNSNWLHEQLSNANLNLSKYNNEGGSDHKGGFDLISWQTGDLSIVEKSDEADLEKARAKYETDISSIQSKDKRFDLNLCQINTEHSAIQTEMDSVKKVIDKNIEKSFKSFSA